MIGQAVPQQAAGATAASRPAAAGAQPSSPAPSQGAAPGQDKRAAPRTGILDSDEHGDGVRLVPGSDK